MSSAKHTFRLNIYMYVSNRSFILLTQPSDPPRSPARHPMGRLVSAAIRPSVESPANYVTAGVVNGSMDLWGRWFRRSRNKCTESMQYGGNGWNVLEGIHKQASKGKYHQKDKTNFLINRAKNFVINCNSFPVWRPPGRGDVLYLCDVLT